METLELLGANPNLSITIKANELTKAFATLVEGAIDKYRREVEAKPDDVLYTIKQVCEILSVDKSTLWRWQQSGYLVPTKVGGLPRYRKSQIDDYWGGVSNMTQIQQAPDGLRGATRASSTVRYKDTKISLSKLQYSLFILLSDGRCYSSHKIMEHIHTSDPRKEVQYLRRKIPTP